MTAAQRRASLPRTRVVNLALQGGGAHGAFTWGVLDRLLEDPRIALEGLSGTSAGSVNAVVLAYGMMQGGREAARAALARLWDGIAGIGAVSLPVRRLTRNTVTLSARWLHT